MPPQRKYPAVTFRLSADLLCDIRNNAGKQGLSMGAFIRDTMADGMRAMQQAATTSKDVAAVEVFHPSQAWGVNP